MPNTAIATKPKGAEGAGLKVAFNILDKWGCSPEQEQAILALKRSSYYTYRDNPNTARLSQDQIERISHVLNMHAALRLVFDNPENVYGFMAMPNHNAYFNGKTPLELIATGSFGALYEVSRRINALRGALIA